MKALSLIEAALLDQQLRFALARPWTLSTRQDRARARRASENDQRSQVRTGRAATAVAPTRGAATRPSGPLLAAAAPPPPPPPPGSPEFLVLLGLLLVAERLLQMVDEALRQAAPRR